MPDGRLDERSLHGGCKPKGEGVEKWGANQWIWNHPNRHRGVFPRRGHKPVLTLTLTLTLYLTLTLTLTLTRTLTLTLT